MPTRPWSSALPLMLALAASGVHAGEIEVPLRLDYEVIRQALNATVFTGPDHTTRIEGDDDGCSIVQLTAPKVDALDGRLRARTSGWAELGVAVGERCLGLPRWTGTITLLSEVEIEPDEPILHLRIVDSQLGSTTGGRTSTEQLWNAVKDQIHPRLEATTIDLGPAIDKARDALTSVLPEARAAEVKEIFASLRIGAIHIEAEGVTIAMRFELPDEWSTAPDAIAAGPEPPLTEAELVHWDTSWQEWDAFSTFVIKSVARDVMSHELRQDLLTALLSTRHELRRVLTSADAQPSEAALQPVIEQTWERLIPILREMSTEVEGAKGLEYAGFLTAADIYRTLDAVAPRFGLDLSADGLKRLARVVTPGLEPGAIRYSQQVDPELRELFGFAPEPVVTIEPPPPELPEPPELAAPVAPQPPELPTRWVAKRSNLDSYLPRMRDLLRDTARRTAADSDLEAHQRVAFQWMVLSTAWQESCWRHWVKRKGEIVPLRSHTGDVGIMQINERVWRGFYDVDALRNDPAYNVQAGAEILAHYLTRYTMPHRRVNTDDVDALARVTYSLYNGGPRRLRRLDSLLGAAPLKRVDQLFWNRYQRVRSGHELEVATCF